MTLLTVPTPTCTRGDTLRRCCESLCAQSFRGLEWLALNDGSPEVAPTQMSELGWRRHSQGCSFETRPTRENNIGTRLLLSCESAMPVSLGIAHEGESLGGLGCVPTRSLPVAPAGWPLDWAWRDRRSHS